MLERIRQFMNRNSPANRGPLLVAVSGGVDSMVLLHLLIQLKADVAVAHCNFKLRGEESDADEVFVKERCAAYGVACHVARMDTAFFAAEHKLSIQEAARLLRYDWFERLMKQHGYVAVATAHHATDQVETMLLHMTRGTGFKGIQGMQTNANGIIRPMLSVTREEIAAYADTHAIVYREDSSNASEKYARNLIRQTILPVLKKVNPAYEQHFLQTSFAVQQLHNWFTSETTKWVSKHVKSSSRHARIPIKPLLKHPAPLLLLQEILRSFDFGFAVVQQVHQALTAQSGKLFFSSSHRLVKDREELIISRISEAAENKPRFSIQKGKDALHTPYFSMTVTRTKRPDELVVPLSVALLDIDTVKFPLVVRLWQAGDKFRPLGMKGAKKVSDFLTDMKLSVEQKENVWVVESDGQIIWVAGWRIDNRQSVTKTTTDVLLLTWEPSTDQ
jgi:tRNA(Ile)-lysidine synthase